MRVAKVKGAKIFPLLIGNLETDGSFDDGYLQKRTSFFRSNLFEKLSTAIPKKSIETANKVMQDFQFPSPPIAEQSVKDIVSELTKYQGYDFSGVDSAHVMEDFVRKVMKVLQKKGAEKTPEPKSKGSTSNHSGTDSAVKRNDDTLTQEKLKVSNECYLEMVNWFQKEGGFSLGTAESYTDLLIDADIANMAKLKRRLKKNSKLLIELGIKEIDAEDILEILLE